jgi:hypothetical protein
MLPQSTRPDHSPEVGQAKSFYDTKTVNRAICALHKNNELQPLSLNLRKSLEHLCKQGERPKHHREALAASLGCLELGSLLHCFLNAFYPVAIDFADYS